MKKSFKRYILIATAVTGMMLHSGAFGADDVWGEFVYADELRILPNSPQASRPGVEVKKEKISKGKKAKRKRAAKRAPAKASKTASIGFPTAHRLSKLSASERQANKRIVVTSHTKLVMAKD